MSRSSLPHYWVCRNARLTSGGHARKCLDHCCLITVLVEIPVYSLEVIPVSFYITAFLVFLIFHQKHEETFLKFSTCFFLSKFRSYFSKRRTNIFSKCKFFKMQSKKNYNLIFSIKIVSLFLKK